MAKIMKRNVIEIPLRVVTFTTGRKVVLSLLVEDNEDVKSLVWAVAVHGESNYPVMFFDNNDDALGEYVKRCGQAVVSNEAGIITNKVYGSLTGYYGERNPPKTKTIVARGKGWRAVKQAISKTPKNPTLKLKKDE